MKNDTQMKSDLYNFDNDIRDKYKVEYVAGFDEAGRGPLCGPVFCAGVLLDANFYNEKINDSKKLNEHTRDILKELIENNALIYKVISIDADTIDRINILEASRLGMQIAFDYIFKNFQNEFVAITDYMKINTENIPLLSIAKGDATSFAVAASSILAKTYRDNYMYDLDKKYPQYDLKNNKGYGTKKHLEALEKFGPILHEHRTSFHPLKKDDFEQEKIF